MTATDGRNRKQYSAFELVFGNLAIILWISLGALAFTFFYWPVAPVFFALSAYLVFYELGKHGCLTCYYCKTCTIGIGKLPELFFKPTGTANVNKRAIRIFPFVYLLLSALPIVFVAASIFQQAAIYKVVLLSAVLVFSAYTGFIRRKTIAKLVR
jgi:hypothetical protein